MPRPELRIVETRVYRGPNYWNYDPAIKLIVDLGVLEHFPTNTITGFVEALLEMLPAVGQHTCGTGRVGGFEDRLRTGTWVGHVAEHIALQLQREAGTEVGRGKTRGTANVFPPRSHPYGQSYAEWAGEWLAWMLSFPAHGPGPGGPVRHAEADRAGGGAAGRHPHRA